MNSFGRIFKISIFGESHGKSVGVTLDGVPAGMSLCEEDFIPDLLRRKSGSKGTTPRNEDDIPEIISGVFNEKTTGAPLTVVFRNNNVSSKDYSNLVNHPRPGHADFTGKIKFGGFNDYRGGGHFSARMTLALVAAGVVAKKIINPAVVSAEIIEIGGERDYDNILTETMKQHDSLGGIIQCAAKMIPAGLGEPYFDSVESVISHLVFSIPAVKGIEFGDGFRSARMKGSEVNDNIINRDGTTEKNSSGGINGGITNSNDIIFRVAFRPTPSISKSQNTYNFSDDKMEVLEIHGRHDACVALRAPVIVESVCAAALADFMILEQIQKRIKE
ncbi:MAG: chorismate synthase [Spirochaetes bacterium]|nr:chorismate synthase [Spirochaetota bacterium]